MLLSLVFVLISKYFIEDGKPTNPDKGYQQIKECVWEYDILGLISVGMGYN